jgi:hypothetical protein
MDLSEADHLALSVNELGDPEALFRISRARWLTKLSLGLLLLVVGVVANYFWWFHGPGQPGGHVELVLLLGLPLTGAALLWHMYRQRGLFVLIYPTGLLRLRRGEVDSFPWAEIDDVRLKVQRVTEAEFTRGSDGTLLECRLPVEVPALQLWNSGMWLTREDGVEAHFGPALTHYDCFAEEVQKRTFQVLWPLVWDRFVSGGTIPFGDLEVSRAGIRFNGKLIRWNDVKELTVAQGKLHLKRTGKWLPWALVDISSIPNPHVLFAVALEASRGHFDVMASPGAAHSKE